MLSVHGDFFEQNENSAKGLVKNIWFYVRFSNCERSRRVEHGHDVFDRHERLDVVN